MAFKTTDGFRIPIEVDDMASPAFNKMASRSKKLIQAMGVLGGSVVVVNQAFALMGRTMQAANRIMDVTFGNFMQFEDALVGVGKTANLSGAALEALGDDFQMLSERIPVSATELADIAKVAGQLGVQGSEDILRFTETMAKLESASNLAGEVGASQVARILNIVEGGVGNVDRFGAAIVALGNNFAATEAEIAHMATEVARSTAIFKPTSAQVLGLSTAMKALGIQAQLGGSAVGRAMREIQATIQVGAGSGFDTLKELTGIVGGDLKQAFETDATGVFQKFIEGLGALDPSQITEKLEDLGLKGDEIAKVLPVLATRSELLGKSLQIANKGYEENIALNEEAEKAFKTLSAEMKKLANVFVNTATDLAGELAPTIKEMIISLREGLVEAVQDTKNKFEALGSALDAIDWDVAVEGLQNLSIAIGLVALAMNRVAIGNFIVSMGSLGLAAGIAAIKFIAIAAAITGVVLAVDFLINNASQLWDTLVVGLASVAQRVVRGLMGMKTAFLLFVEDMLVALEGIPFFGDKIAGALESVRGELKDTADSFDEINENIEEVDGLLDDVTSKDFDMGIIGDIIEQGKKALDAFNDTLDETSKKGKKASDSLDLGPEFGPELPPTPAPEKEIKGSLFSDEDISLITDSFGGGVGEFASAANSMTAVPLAMVAAANIILDAVQGLIDAIPNLLNKVADIFTSLTELPQKIVEAVINVFTAFSDFVGNILSNLINGITDLLLSVVEFFVNQLPAAIQSIIEKLPEAILRLFDELPAIIEGLVFGFITSLVDIFVILPIELIKAMPRIAVAFIKMMPLVAIAFVDGAIEGLKSGINALAESLGFGEIFDLGNVAEEFEEIGDKIAKSSSQLFAVVDLEASQRGLDLADRIRNAISSSGKEVGNILSKLWEKLTVAWEWIRDNIIDPFIDGVEAIWLFARDQVFMPVINALQDVWDFVVDEVISPLVDGLMDVWDFVKTNIIDPIVGAVTSLFNGIKGVFDAVVAAVGAIFSGDFSGLKEAISSAFNAAFEGLSDAFAAMINPLIDLFNNLSLPEVEVSGKVLGKSFGFTLIPETDLIPGEIQRLQHGGPVQPQRLQAGGIAGTDSVEISATPGEFVVNREQTRNNLNLLKSINSGQGPVSAGGATNISVVMNIKTNLDKQAIKRDILPEVKSELKKESQRGAFIISQRGIRT